VKKLWLYSVRAYVRIGLFFYFRRIHIHGLNNIPKDKPVLLLSNHQNALLDALLIATKCGRFAYFLTRAAVFKKPFVSKILNSLQMLPVYRVRDGWKTIANNNAIFKTCSELLHQNELVVIFPEGSHNLVRRVRPLSKGFTRIVFDTLEKYPDTDLQLIPVGLNFVNAVQFPDSAALYFGSPISAKSFVLDNRKDSVVNLKKTIQSEISKLTTHIPIDDYDNSLRKLDALRVNYLEPKQVNTCIEENFENCRQLTKSKIHWLKQILKMLLIVNILPPYLIWKLIFQPKIKELEFVATFRFAVTITLVPIYLLSIAFVLSALLSLKLAIIYVISVLILSLITTKL